MRLSTIHNLPDDDEFAPDMECPRCEQSAGVAVDTSITYNDGALHYQCGYCGFDWKQWPDGEVEFVELPNSSYVDPPSHPDE